MNKNIYHAPVSKTNFARFFFSDGMQLASEEYFFIIWDKSVLVADTEAPNHLPVKASRIEHQMVNTKN